MTLLLVLAARPDLVAMTVAIWAWLCAARSI
jgi:hypothetical protein